MSFRTRLAAFTAAVIVLAGIGGTAWWIRRDAPLRSPRANILLVTIDTLRADRLGSYGHLGAETPRLDQLAAEGVRFDEVIAPVPLTLPSHMSLMTSLNPPEHGLRDNGQVRGIEPAPTLAELLAAEGYACGAFVGAEVLHSRWGLNAGFEVYDDRFEYDEPVVQRRADAVVDAALPWLAEPRDRPFFAWVHVYDPHSPYDAPEPFGSRHSHDPYDGEVAFSDHQVGRLLDLLADTGRLDDTIVLITSDHGEDLGDHGELSHGLFLYDATLRVPLILRLPGRRMAGLEVTAQVALIDVAPTLLELVGVAVPDNMSGASLGPFLEGRGEPRPAYAETFYPRWHFGWQELYALRRDGFKYILAPRPELYELSRDPGETVNVLDDRPRLAAAMAAEIEARRGAPPSDATGDIPEAVAERLRALGYIGRRPATLPAGPLADPKEKVHLFRRLIRSNAMLLDDRIEELAASMRAVIDEDPQIVDAHFNLGNALFHMGEYAGAAEAFATALELSPEYDLALANLGLAHLRMGDVEAAKADFEALLSRAPDNPSAHVNLGEIALLEGRPAAALAHFEAGIEANASLAELHIGLGVAALQLGDVERAAVALDGVAERVPKYPEVHYYRAQVAEQRGDPRGAAKLYLEELENNPEHYKSWINLGQLRAAGQDLEGAVTAFENAVRVAPDMPHGHILLARSLLALEDPQRLPAAEEAARRGLALDPPPELRPLAHYVLVDVYTRLGRPDEARRELELARRAEQAIR